MQLHSLKRDIVEGCEVTTTEVVHLYEVAYPMHCDYRVCEESMGWTALKTHFFVSYQADQEEQ